MRTTVPIFALAVAAAATGCSTTSTITRTSGVRTEGHIVGGDDSYVYVGPKNAPEAIPRAEIKDIDYPGDGATVVGGIFTGYGLLNIAVGAPQCQEKGAAFCTGVFAPAALGISMVIWGVSTHSTAVDRARTPVRPNDEARIFFTPMIGTERGQPSGAAFAGTF